MMPKFLARFDDLGLALSRLGFAGREDRGLKLLIEHEEMLNPLTFTLKRFLAVKAVHGFVVSLMHLA